MQVNVTGGKSYEPRLDIIAVLKFGDFERTRISPLSPFVIRFSLLLLFRNVKDFEGNFSRSGVFFFFYESFELFTRHLFREIGKNFVGEINRFFLFFVYIYGILRELLPWMKIQFFFF